MSSVPGGSGENIIYTFFLSAQTYSTLSTDGARFSDRITEINARPKKEWVPKPWPPTSTGTE
uniref:Uncharacterized protein n=1 Tax=Mastacembelus armatus TaxID=205130 RepID=A0A3Q3KQR7_9TELE